MPKESGNWERKNRGPEKAREHGDVPLRPQELEPKEKFPQPDYAPKRQPGKASLARGATTSR